MSRRLLSFALCAVLCAVPGRVSAAPAVSGGSYSVTFRHAAGKAAIASGADATYALSVLDSISFRAGSKIRQVFVRSYGSPEGKLSWNSRLAALRSSKVVDIIKEKCPALADSLIVVSSVPEDWDSALAYLRAGDKKWKDEAIQIIKSGGDRRKEKLQDLWAGEAWDDLLWNCFFRLRRTEVSIDFAPDFEFSKSSEPAKTGEYSLKFPVGRTSVQAWYLDNAGTVEDLRSLANTAAASGQSIRLDSYSSPEGRSSWNLVLARRRAESVKRFLLSAGVPAENVVIGSCTEDWDGLRASVESSYFGSDKSDILSIIGDSSLGSDERKSALAALSGGAAWSRLIGGWMQDLRRVKVSLIE